MFTEEKEYYKNLPKKRMGAGALLFNDKNELLIVKPGYKPYWSIPGGVVEADESPRAACVREVKEETGIDMKNPKFLCVDYYYDPAKPEKDESLQFIFYGGRLNDAQIKNIRIQESEISEYRFARLEDAIKILGARQQKRLAKGLEAIKNNSAFYLENGD